MFGVVKIFQALNKKKTPEKYKNQYLARVFEKSKHFRRSKTSQCHSTFANYMRQLKDWEKITGDTKKKKKEKKQYI